MNRNIESVASIFLEQIEASPINNEGYKIDEYVSDLEEEIMAEPVMKNGDEQMNEGSMEDIYNLSGTLTSEFETEICRVRNIYKGKTLH